jgi:bacteriorhodopsin
MGLRATEKGRGHFAHKILIVLMAMTNYIALAFTQGVERAGEYTYFGYARFIDCSVTTPLLLLGLELLALPRARDSLPLVLSIIAVDLYMIATGLFAGLSGEGRGVWWAWFIVSSLAFVVLYAMIFGPLAKKAKEKVQASEAMQKSGDPVERYLGMIHASEGKWFAPMAGLLALIWLIYPVIFFLDKQGIGAYTHPTSDALYTIVDVTAEVVYGFVFLGGILAIEKRAAGAMGRSPREMDEEEYMRFTSELTRHEGAESHHKLAALSSDPGGRRRSVGAPHRPVGRQSTRWTPRRCVWTEKTTRTCAARRAADETTDASEHYRVVEREGHIRRSHRRRSLPHTSEQPKTGRPALLSHSEVITLAILAQWPRFRSERDFWRFASSHLRSYFPTLCSQSQLNQRIRALEPELRLLQRAFAEELSEPSAVYRVLDTTLVPAMVRVRASRKGLFCGQATFGRSASKTEWVYGFKVALVVDPEGVVSTFFLAPAASDERPIGDALISSDSYDAYLADKGFTGIEWERRWLEVYGALVAATPKNGDRRAWPKSE